MKIDSFIPRKTQSTRQPGMAHHRDVSITTTHTEASQAGCFELHDIYDASKGDFLRNAFYHRHVSAHKHESTMLTIL
jgi:hypothetical protein